MPTQPLESILHKRQRLDATQQLAGMQDINLGMLSRVQGGATATLGLPTLPMTNSTQALLQRLPIKTNTAH